MKDYIHCSPARTKLAHVVATAFAGTLLTLVSIGHGRAQSAPQPPLPQPPTSQPPTSQPPASQPPASQPPSKRGKPWLKGTPLEDRKAAIALFEEGNTLMDDQQFVEADKKYAAAIARWDHPVFHFNRTTAQINLLQPIEAYESIKQALRHDDAPFEQVQYQHARATMKKLEGNLGHATIKCAQNGVRVTLDGKLLFIGPGEYKNVMRPGSHQLVATKDGYITDTRLIVGDAGKPTDVAVQLVPPKRLKAVRRWAAWKPWVVVGAGALALGAAGFLDWNSSQGFISYDASFVELCGEAGCQREELPTVLADELAGAETKQTLAQISYGVAGATLVVGAVLAYLNREKFINVAEAPEEPGSVSFVPVISNDAVGVRAGIRF